MLFTHWDERSRHSTSRFGENWHKLGLTAEGIARMFKRLYYSHSQGRPANTVFEGTAECGKALDTEQSPLWPLDPSGPIRDDHMYRVVSFGKTDTGLRRTNNEDAFYVDQQLGICALADGMGGAAAGELASQLFADTAREVFSVHSAESEEQQQNLLQRTYELANERILDHVRENPGHAGMGCTAELVRFYEQKFVLGHVGDSRTYLFRNGEFKQLTRDHSLVQDQLDLGLITPEEARKHRLRNVILRAVGTKEALAVDFIRGRLVPGDIFLLCSDGLTDMLEDDSILEILTVSSTIGQKVDKLVEMAKSAGGNDNITVILSKVIQRQ
jgi:PPM family protein phosphatase